jgi:hypothetical protein
MLIPIYQIIKANRSLETLISQQNLYNINIAYKLYKTKKELDEIENYAFERLSLICPNIDLNNPNEDELLVHNTIINSQIELNIPTLTEEELLSNNEIKLSIEDIENILNIFIEK